MTEPTTQPAVPPIERVRTGRPFNTSTPLGQWMKAEHYGVRDVTRVTGINERTLSDYLAGRKRIIVGHVAELSRLTGLSAEVLNGGAVEGPATSSSSTPAPVALPAPSRSALVSHIRRRSA